MLITSIVGYFTTVQTKESRPGEARATERVPVRPSRAVVSSVGRRDLVGRVLIEPASEAATVCDLLGDLSVLPSEEGLDGGDLGGAVCADTTVDAHHLFHELIRHVGPILAGLSEFRELLAPVKSHSRHLLLVDTSNSVY